MRKQKIMFGIDNLGRGGTELQLLNLINGLNRDFFEPHLMTFFAPPEGLLPPGLPVINLDLDKVASLRGVQRILDVAYLLRKNDFSVVQSYFAGPTTVLGLAAIIAGVPVRVACFRDLGFWLGGREKSILKAMMPFYNLFVSNSQSVKEYYGKLLGLNEAKHKVIYNGADSRTYFYRTHPGSTTDIAFLGNLNRKVKRPDLYVLAACHLAPKYPHVLLHVFGGGLSGSKPAGDG